MTESITSRIIYKLGDKPPFPRALLLATQHVLTMFGATVSVPLLLGPLMGMNAPQIATLISSVMLCSGLATFVQITIGSRLPIIQGVSFSFLGPFFAIIASCNKDGPLTMQYIAGAVILGSLVEMAIGWFGLIGKIRKVLSPVVIGPVIILISLSLFEVGAPKAGTYWPVAGFVIVLIILFSQILSRRSLLFRLFPIILAIVIGYLTALGGSLSGLFPPGHPAHVSLATVGQTSWFKPIDTIFFPWGMPKFSLAFFFAVLASYLASMVESIGDYHAVSYLSGAGDPSSKQLSRGIGAEGIGCFITGCLGGFASTSYSENIGLIGITRVASRYVVLIGAGVLVFLGLFTKFGALCATIPEPVVGALYCTLFGLIAGIGIQQISKADLYSDRNLLIIGFSLFMGLSVPAFFKGVPALGYAPGSEWFSANFPKSIADIINAIGTTGMAVSAILGLILDNVIPGTEEERGLVRDNQGEQTPV